MWASYGYKYIAYREKLRTLIDNHFNLSDIETLCFDLGVDYENIPGKSKEATIRHLISHFEKYKILSVLVEKCQQMRPTVEWPTLTEANSVIVAPVKPSPTEEENEPNLIEKELWAKSRRLSPANRATVEQIFWCIKTILPSDISGSTLKGFERDLHQIVFSPENLITDRRTLEAVGNGLDYVSSACATLLANLQNPPPGVSRGLLQAYRSLDLAILLDDRQE